MIITSAQSWLSLQKRKSLTWLSFLKKNIQSNLGGTQNEKNSSIRDNETRSGN